MISLRPVSLETDLPAMVRLLNLKGLEPLSAEQVREWWRPTQGEIRHTQMALNEPGEIAGMVDAGHDAGMQPGDYRLNVLVDAAWQNRGIGSRLFAEGSRFALAEGASRLRSTVRDNQPAALRFAEHRGYRLHRHVFESVLDLDSFDERPFVDHLARARAAGFHFFSLADLEPVTEEHRLRLYELNRETGLDNPTNEGLFLPFEDFCQFVFDAPWFRADGQILAADGNRWVGLAAVHYQPEAHSAYNAFTGVDRAHRGRGLAQALKLLGVWWAKECGAHRLRTNNDSENAPMLAINRRMGYRPEPGIYHLVCDLATR